MDLLLVEAEEVATLEAAFAFIDECREESEELVSVESVPVATLNVDGIARSEEARRVAMPTSLQSGLCRVEKTELKQEANAVGMVGVKTKSPPPRRRRQQNQELALLRTEVQELQVKLNALRNSVPSSAAREFAKMQERWLEVAKVENNRLRERVRGQLKTVNGIKRILYRLTSLQHDGPIKQMPKTVIRDFPIHVDTDLARDSPVSLAEFYPQIDHVFQIYGATGRESPTDLIVQKAGEMDGILVRDYCLALEEGSTKFQVHGNHSMRRYIEPNRIVIVFAGMAQPVEALGRRVTGIEFRERGWIVVTQALEQEPDVCIVSSCCEVTLDVGARLENPGAIVPELSRMLVAYKRKNFRSIQQELENRLVAQE
ncbi:hypothetical protein BBJ28_00004072 [Nothophytophthora sp. Chile5]|nr:hypothetical protein BBJ28_00004072 [Nothophytophthora sp. Chile5]